MRANRTKPTRVLIIVQNLPVPFDRRVWLEATALKKHGYEVSVICPNSPFCRKLRETIDGIEIYRYPEYEARLKRLAFVIEFTYCWIATFILSIWIRLFGGGFAVIHACNPPDTFFALAMLYKPFGTRFIFDQHDLCPELYLSKYHNCHGDKMHRMLQHLERWTYKTADVVISTNESYRKVAIERGDRSLENTFVVRTGPDEDRVHPVPADQKERHGADCVVGYLGTMGVQDGVDELIHAFSICIHKHKRNDLHLVLIGSGAATKDLKALSKELDVDRHVTFHGRVKNGDRFQTIMCSMDICVSPDPYNPLNDKSTMNKTMEYMGFGRAVVAYGLTETMVSGGDVVDYVEPGNREQLAEKIVELADDPQRREEMGQAGIRRVRDHLAWRHSVPSLLTAYDRVLGERGIPLGSMTPSPADGPSAPSSSVVSHTPRRKPALSEVR